MTCRVMCSALTIVAITLTIGCGQSPPVEPVAVAPSDGEPAANGHDATPHEDAPRARRADDIATEPEVSTPPRPAVGEVEGGGVWVVDSAGQDVGALLRRGSDDNLVYRSIYDLVTVYHPTSGLIFEITMTDAVVRYPSTTFFSTAACEGPIGISYGGCAECRSGPGTALLHLGSWYTVVPGVTFEVVTAGSTRGSGLEASCSSHHTDSAKVFPVTEVGGETPPKTFTPPLHFAWK